MAVPKLEYPVPEWVYHWAPRDRRKSIERTGLEPGKLARGLEGHMWRPPFVCYSTDPVLAWQLSGHHGPSGYWDLWSVHTADLDSWEIITDTYVDTGRTYIKELRVYHRVWKRNVVWIAERELTSQTRRK